MKDRGKIVICIATGPSLRESDVKIIDDHKDSSDLVVIGVNDSWTWKRSDGSFLCDHVYAADQSFWEMYLNEMNRKGLDAIRWMPLKADFCKKNGIRLVKLLHGTGLCKDENTVNSGSHSGYQAINLAYHLGARKIILLGYEMKVDDANKIHFFGNHPRGLRNHPGSYSKWIIKYNDLARDLSKEGVDIINCSRNTAIPYFRKESPESMYNHFSSTYDNE